MGGGGDPSPNLPVPRWVIRYTSLQCINAVCKYFLLEAQETLHYFTNYTFKHAKLLSLGNQYVRHPMIYIKWRLAYSREKYYLHFKKKHPPPPPPQKKNKDLLARFTATFYTLIQSNMSPRFRDFSLI